MDCKICLPLFFFVGLSAVVSLSSALNNRPIIGVLSQKTIGPFAQYGKTYIAASYVKYLESAGARVVPILVDQPDGYYKKMFNSLNGVLFPGGGQPDLLKSGYGKAGRLFYDMSIQSFEETGDYFPVWGTCLGFELLSMLTGKGDLLTNTDGDVVSLTLTFEKDFRKSQMYSTVSESIIKILTMEDVTLNHHRLGLTPKNFSKNANLKDFYHVLSTSFDKKGVQFISSMEAYKYPIFGVQFHPEKNCFEWKDSTINHSQDAVQITQFFADFIVSEARKSSHAFASETEANSFLIYNHLPVYTNNISSFEQAYFFSP